MFIMVKQKLLAMNENRQSFTFSEIAKKNKKLYNEKQNTFRNKYIDIFPDL